MLDKIHNDSILGTGSDGCVRTHPNAVVQETKLVL